MSATVISIQVGLPRVHGESAASGAAGEAWTTGMFKQPVAGPVWLGRTNLAGDGQADLENHGGFNKAVNVYPAEHYPQWEAELGIGPLGPGAFGENFTIQGLLESAVCVGDVFSVGAALVQVSQPRQPCWKLSRRWDLKDLAFRVQQTGRTGWYFRVLREGRVQAGDRLELTERPHAEWPVALANEVMHQRQGDLEAARALAACAALSDNWREKLQRRSLGNQAQGEAARLDGPRD